MGKSTKPPTFKVGQRVAWTARTGSMFRAEYRGVVVRLTPTTVLIKPDLGGEVTRVRRDARLVTPLTPDQLAIEEWMRKRPETSTMTLSTFGAGAWYVRKPSDLSVNVGRFALTDVAAVASDADALVRWLATFPEKKP